MQRNGKHLGFSLVEVLLVAAIFGALATMATVQFAAHKHATVLRTTVQDLSFYLEQARADALSGKGNVPQGIKFNADSYDRFGGAAYTIGDPNNVRYTIDDQLQLSTTLSGDETIVFSRLTGSTDGTATVTVSYQDDVTDFQQIVIGPRGDITIIE